MLQDQQGLDLKNKFLLKENQQLKDQLEDLQEMLRLNKQALHLSFSEFPDRVQKNKKVVQGVGLQDQKQKNISQDQYLEQKQQNQQQQSKSSVQSQAVNKVLQQLYEENQQLLYKLDSLQRERDQAQGESLVNEQMYQRELVEKQELLEEMRVEREFLFRKVKEQEQIILELEKVKPEYDEISGVVIKYREVVKLSDQNQIWHNELQSLSQELLRYKKIIQSLEFDKNELVKINIRLSQEMVKMRASNSSQFSLQQNLRPQRKKDYEIEKEKEQVLNLHKKFLKKKMDEDDEEEEDEEDEDEMGSNIFTAKPKKETNLKTDNFTTLHTQQNNNKVPKLDLSKAKQIQDINAKRSTLQQQQKQTAQEGAALNEKLKKSETVIDRLRKNLAKEMLLNKTLQMENEEIQRNIMEIQARNETFINSYLLYEEKWKQIFSAFSFYKDFYKNFKDEVGSSSKRIQSQNYQTDTHDSINQERSMIKNYKKNQLHNSIIDLKNEDIDLQQNFKDNFMNIPSQDQIYNQILQKNEAQNNQSYRLQFNKENAQEFLLGMAAELYNKIGSLELGGERLNQKSQLKGRNTNKKRSYSNPMNQIIDDDFLNQNEQSTKQQSKKMDRNQSYFQPNNNQNVQIDLDQMDLNDIQRIQTEDFQKLNQNDISISEELYKQMH